MQTSTTFNYAFSANEKDKKNKDERKPQPRRKLSSYIDTKYAEREEPDQRDEMDKDVVF